jgi:hypothetical protein
MGQSGGARQSMGVSDDARLREKFHAGSDGFTRVLELKTAMQGDASFSTGTELVRAPTKLKTSD